MQTQSKPVQLVIEGVGDVVKKNYFPALQEVKADGKRKFETTFVDNSAFWAKDRKLRDKMLAIQKALRGWGANYLDKSNKRQNKQVEDLRPDVVIVATPDSTHSKVTSTWLGSAAQRIFIEKPLDSCIDAVRCLMGETRPYDRRLFAFDHYRARLLPTRAKFHMLEGFLKAGIESFTFYFLEDQSGDDPKYAAARGGRQGPIENEQRVKALQQGVILDLMPHVIAILAHFGRVETVRVTHIRAGKYEGVDGVRDQPSEIDGETFADVRFTFEAHDQNWVNGVAFVGKGVRGVESLGKEHDRNVKFLRIGTKDGRTVDFDFRKSGAGASTARLVDEQGALQFEFPLIADPYYAFLDNALNLDTELDQRLGLSLETGKKVLEVIEDMRRPIASCKRAARIESYPCGIYQKRRSPSLEDLIERNTTKLGWNYGRDEFLPERALAAAARES